MKNEMMSDNWKDKNVVVTGGAGFIGQHLVRCLLNKDAVVTIVDKRQIPRTEASILSLDVLKPTLPLEQAIQKADIIFHLASYSSAAMFKQFALPYRENVVGLLNILETASKSKNTKRIVFPSSSTVYAGHPLPWKENLFLDTPVNWYAASKLTSEILCKHFAMKHRNIETVCLRIFCGYGPGEEHKGIYASPLSQFIWSISSKRSPEIWGNGQQERDFVFIDDIVDALLLAAMEPVSGEVFNVGSGTSTTFLKVIQVINDMLGTDVSPKFIKPKLESYIDKTLADTSKAERVLGFKAKVTLREAIKKTINTYSKKCAYISQKK